MIISRIEYLKNKRSNIYIDDKIAFVLYKGDLCKYNLNEGEEITIDLYERIISETLCKRAFLRSMHLLEKKDYTTREIREKLSSALYPEKAVEYAVSELEGFGYLNDLRYAERYIELSCEKRSRREISHKLSEKGISRAIIEEAFINTRENGYIIDENELITEILKKRHYFEKDHTPQEKSKQYNYLMSKGFSSEAVINALKN